MQMSTRPGANPFETLVVGSLPRPRWVRDLIEDRKAGRASEEEVSTLLDDAIPSAIHMQERAGLDFVSDGEWRRESYLKVFSEAVDGFEADLIEDGMVFTVEPGIYIPGWGGVRIEDVVILEGGQARLLSHAPKMGADHS